jgi:hypothetical protein
MVASGDVENTRLSGSFRDPGGYVLERGGSIFRVVHESRKSDFGQLLASGLYRQLVEERLLIDHEDVEPEDWFPPDAWKILRPRRVRFISYPYEWSFGQLREAALLTLTIERRALSSGMSLRDCSAYNVQFEGYRPIFIDTLSFEEYEEGRPWRAYRQFCQHFLAPLALMSRSGQALGRLLQLYLDGVPLDVASVLLPKQSWFNLGLLGHIHLHAKSILKMTSDRLPDVHLSRKGLLTLVDDLRERVGSLEWKPAPTPWADYSPSTTYAHESRQHKSALIGEFLDAVGANDVWDFGASDGAYSRISSSKGIPTVSMDSDPAAVGKNYQRCREEKDEKLLPLIVDLLNPSPPIGWAGQERLSLLERSPAGAVLLLALVHHLTITEQIPFEKIAGLMARLTRVLVVELPLPDDPQVELLRSRKKPEDLHRYDQQSFERVFAESFLILRREEIRGSRRVLYLLERRAA